MTSAPRKRQASVVKRLWRIAQQVFALVLVATIFLAIVPQVAGYDAVWKRVSSITGASIAVLVAAASVNLLTYWVQSMAAMPGLTLGMAIVENQTATSVADTIPGGGAIAVGISFGIFRSWGYTEGDVARFTVLTGIWNLYVKFGLPILALALLVISGRTYPGLFAAAAAGIAALVISVALLILVLRSESLARRIGNALWRPVAYARRLLHRRTGRGWGQAAVRFRKDTIELLDRRWLALTGSTLASHMALFVVLFVSIRAVGIPGSQVSLVEALAVFSFARLVSAFPVTPAGLGVVELGYIGGLIWAGAGRTDAVAASLLFRALTYLLQIPLGGITYLVWQQTRNRWRRTDRRARERERRRTTSRARVARSG